MTINNMNEIIDIIQELLNESYRNTCMHEETHREGIIWEVCDRCGCRWSDDRNPKPPYSEPEIWVQAEKLLRKLRETKICVN